MNTFDFCETCGLLCNQVIDFGNIMFFQLQYDCVQSHKMSPEKPLLYLKFFTNIQNHSNSSQLLPHQKTRNSTTSKTILDHQVNNQDMIPLREQIENVFIKNQEDQTAIVNATEIIANKAKLLIKLWQVQPDSEIDFTSQIVDRICREGRNYQLLMQVLEGQEELVKRKRFFHLYFGMVYLWVNQKVIKTTQQLWAFFQSLTNRLAYIEHKFIKINNQFEILPQLLKICCIILGFLFQKSHLYPIQHILSDWFNPQLKPISSHNPLLQTSSTIQINSNCQGTISIYYQTLRKYSLLDPNFRIYLIRNIFILAQNELSGDVIDQHLIIINELVGKRIFIGYEIEILQQIMSTNTISVLRNDHPSIKVINTLLQIISKGPQNFHKFLISQKSNLIGLGIHIQLKKTIFNFYFQSLKREEKHDNQIIDFMVLWNLKLNIQVDQFITFLKNRGLSMLSESTLHAICSSESQFAHLLLECKLLQTLKSKDLKHEQLFSECLLHRNQKSYIFCVNILIKMITNVSNNNINFKKQLTYLTISENELKNPHIKTKVLFLIKKAAKNSIRSLEFVEKVVFVGALLEDINIFGIQSDSVLQYYIDSIKSLKNEEVKMLIESLQVLFQITATKITLFLALCCLIQLKLNKYVSNSWEQKYLLQMFENHEKNSQHKVMSFSGYSLKAIVLYSQFPENSPKIREICQDFMVSWSPLFSKFQTETIFFQFDSKLFHPLLKCFNMELPILSNTRNNLIINTIKTIEKLLSAPYCTPKTFLSPYLNEIEVIPIRTQSQKNSLEIKFQFCFNRLKNCNSCIDIYSSPRQQKFNHIINKQRISLFDGKLIFQNRTPKQVLFCSQTLPTTRMINFRIKIAQQKLRICIDNISVFAYNANYLVDHIRFELHGDLLIKDVQISRFQNQKHQMNPFEHYIIYPNEIELRMTKTSAIILQEVNAQVSRKYLFGYLNQIYNMNSQVLDVAQFYNVCFSILLKSKETDSDRSDETDQLKLLFYFFKRLREKFTSSKTLAYDFNAISTSVKSTGMYYSTLIAAYFNQQYISLCPLKQKRKIIDHVHLLMTDNFQMIWKHENSNLDLFSRIFTICEIVKNEELLATKLLPLARFIIMKHSINGILLTKLRYFFFISESTQIDYIQQFFGEVFGDFVIQLFDSKTNQALQTINMLMNQLKQFGIMFQICPLKDKKYPILDHFLSNSMATPKLLEIIFSLSDNQYVDLSDWIICNAKRSQFQYFEYQVKTEANAETLIFLVQCLIKLVIIKESQIEEQVKILSQFFSQGTDNKPKKQLEIINEFCLNQSFFKIILFAIEQIDGNSQYQEMLRQMLKNCFDMLFYSPKRIVLLSLVRLRKSISLKFYMYKYIYELGIILTLRVCSLSYFLQFTYEVLVLAKHNLHSDSNILQQLTTQIKNYLSCLIKNYSSIQKLQIKHPLLYSFPKLQKKKNLEAINNINHVLQAIASQQFRELPGGIYFKLMIIILYLLELSPKEDYTQFLEFILYKSAESAIKSNKKYAVNRAISDFNQVIKETKQRNEIQLAMRYVGQEHEKYYQGDNFIEMVQLKNSRNSQSRNSHHEVQLNVYLADYFFMKYFAYLENFSENDKIFDEANIQKDIDIVLNYLKKCEPIVDDMNEKNIDYVVEYEQAEQLLKMIKISEEPMVSDMMNSPLSRKLSNVHEQEQVQMNQLTDLKFLTPPSFRKKRTFSFSFDSSKKKISQILTQFPKNPKYWSKYSKSIKLHRYFNNQSKVIHLIEMLHTCYVILTTDEVQEESISNTKKCMKFFQEFNNNSFSISHQEIMGYKQMLKNIELRCVYPFTIKEKPVIKLKSLCFPNMTNPLMKYSKIGNYGDKACLKNERRSLLMQQAPASFIKELEGETEFTQNMLLIKFPQSGKEVCLLEQEDDQKNLNFCDLSFRKGKYFCEYEFLENKIVFKTKKTKISPHPKFDRIIKYGAPSHDILQIQAKQIQLQIDKVYDIFYRKFNQIINNSIEVFFKNGSSFMIIFYTEERVSKFLSECQKEYKNFKSIRIVKNLVKEFKDRGYSEKWSKGQLSNFDYLMLVNKYAGRSLADLNQYYVFPWVLQDYTSQSLDLHNEDIYRDLRKPIGALNQTKLQKFLEKYEEQQFFYGSHYSTSLFILHYLVRIEPFTTLHCDMQSGQFDSPDRIFNSIAQTWSSLMDQTLPTYISQAIPQFYYMPTFLQNVNYLNMGIQTTSGKRLDGVQLPPWSHNPTHFIHMMRRCLQSDYVSLHLNHWIDLIFGVHQHSAEKYNIFHQYAYQENINPNKIKDGELDGVMSQIYYYGQNPIVLFPHEQHVRKKLSNSLSKSLNLKSIKTNRVEEKLQKQYYIRSYDYKKNIIRLKIHEINKKIQAFIIDLNMQNCIQTLIRSIQEKKPAKLHKMQSLRDTGQSLEDQRQLQLKVDKAEVTIAMKTLNEEETVKKIKFQEKFSKSICNQSVIIVYGPFGLIAYDWQMQKVTEIDTQKGQIIDVYLQSTYFFYLTSFGNLYVYDFCTKRCQLICYINETKPTKKAQMLVYTECKVPTSNQFHYKFLLIGDLRNVVIFSYAHSLKVNKIE